MGGHYKGGKKRGGSPRTSRMKRRHIQKGCGAGCGTHPSCAGSTSCMLMRWKPVGNSMVLGVCPEHTTRQQNVSSSNEHGTVWGDAAHEATVRPAHHMHNTLTHTLMPPASATDAPIRRMHPLKGGWCTSPAGTTPTPSAHRMERGGGGAPSTPPHTQHTLTHAQGSEGPENVRNTGGNARGKGQSFVALARGNRSSKSDPTRPLVREPLPNLRERPDTRRQCCPGHTPHPKTGAKTDGNAAESV